jgi:hypothetical protein
MNAHRSIFEYDSVSDFLGRLHILLGGILQFDVDRAGSGAQVKGSRFGSTSLNEGLRQDMLAGVLLHMVQAACCVDPTLDSSARGREWSAGSSVGDVDYTARLVFGDVDDFDACD